MGIGLWMGIQPVTVTFSLTGTGSCKLSRKNVYICLSFATSKNKNSVTLVGWNITRLMQMECDNWHHLEYIYAGSVRKYIIKYKYLIFLLL